MAVSNLKDKKFSRRVAKTQRMKLCIFIHVTNIYYIKKNYIMQNLIEIFPSRLYAFARTSYGKARFC